jgi:hypothetical protein
VRVLRDAEEARQKAARVGWEAQAGRLRAMVPGSAAWVEGMVGAPLEGGTWAALGKNDGRLQAILRERVAGERRRRKRWRVRWKARVPEMNARGAAVARYRLVDEGPVPKEGEGEPPDLLEPGSPFRGYT